MYQPYLRGKQFELLGLRELLENNLISDKISPILEPVKESSTLKITINLFVKKNFNFTYIINPQVGSFTDIESNIVFLKSLVENFTNFQIGIIFHNRINLKEIVDLLKQYSLNDFSLSLIHIDVFDDIFDKLELVDDFTVLYNVINLSLTKKRYQRNFDSDSLVELDDYFKSQDRNSDYLKTTDTETFFSDEYLFYKKEGYVGFSDYQTIGSHYNESGMLPLAVAIHLSYEKNGKIYVKHFVSDTNFDRSDVAGKYLEAIKKLVDWCNNKNYNNYAITQFKNYYNELHFPGLGVLKKLSLINHINLVNSLI